MNARGKAWTLWMRHEEMGQMCGRSGSSGGANDHEHHVKRRRRVVICYAWRREMRWREGGGRGVVGDEIR